MRRVRFSFATHARRGLRAFQPPPCLPPRTAGGTVPAPAVLMGNTPPGRSPHQRMHTRTCGQQIAERSLPVAEIPFRIGTLSRWVRAAASHPPSLDPDASGEFEGGEIPPQSIQKNTHTKEDPSRHYSSTTSALGRNGSGPSARRGVQRPRRPLAGGYGGEEPLSRERGRLASRNLPGVIFSDCRNAREKLRS